MAAARLELNLNSLTNLVVHEVEPNEGYARRDINLAGSLNNVAIPMGTLVYRTIASGQLDQDAPYSPVGPTNDNALVVTNEFAVVFGDRYSAKDSFNTIADAVTATPAVAFVRGEVQLKEDTVSEANALTNRGTDDANQIARMVKVRALLEKQGIILLKSDAVDTSPL